ncbi:hypothetical protein GR255_28150, partial [Mycobacterium tuberculosis]|nr:hypothetical protein [Mycobacterium tuberculosis]
KAEERGSLALTTDTTKGDTRDTAFIEIKKANADKKIIGTIINTIDKARNPSITRPRKRTLSKAEERGSLALTTDTTKGDTRDTAFIEIKKANA